MLLSWSETTLMAGAKRSPIYRVCDGAKARRTDGQTNQIIRSLPPPSRNRRARRNMLQPQSRSEAAATTTSEREITRDSGGHCWQPADLDDSLDQDQVTKASEDIWSLIFSLLSLRWIYLTCYSAIATFSPNEDQLLGSVTYAPSSQL